MASIKYFYSRPRSKVTSLEALEFWSGADYSRKIQPRFLISIMKNAKNRHVVIFHVDFDKEIRGIKFWTIDVKFVDDSKI